MAWWNSDKMVLRMHGAREITPDERDPALRRYAEDTIALADRAGMPRPRVYVIDTPQPNAFATGRDPHNAAVAATTGLLSRLTREEVAGVMAHELAHVKNRDTLTMTVTATLAGAIGFLANFALFFGGGRDRGGFWLRWRWPSSRRWRPVLSRWRYRVRANTRQTVWARKSSAIRCRSRQRWRRSSGVRAPR